MIQKNDAEVQYLAELKIERIERPAATGPHPPKKERTEVTRMVVKANTMAKLTEKLSKHIAIMEED